MTPDFKDAARVVALTRRQLLDQQRDAQRRAADEASALVSPMHRLQALARLLRAADRRGYAGAGRRLQRRFERQVDDLSLALRRWSLTDTTAPRMPTPRDLLDELDQLDDEFGGWVFDRRARTLAVTTEPITLEDIDLGRFRVKLELGSAITF